VNVETENPGGNELELQVTALLPRLAPRMELTMYSVYVPAGKPLIETVILAPLLVKELNEFDNPPGGDIP